MPLQLQQIVPAEQEGTQPKPASPPPLLLPELEPLLLPELEPLLLPELEPLLLPDPEPLPEPELEPLLLPEPLHGPLTVAHCFVAES